MKRWSMTVMGVAAALSVDARLSAATLAAPGEHAFTMERAADAAQRADDEQQRAEDARQRAEDERQRAEDQRQRAEDRRQRADDRYEAGQDALEEGEWARAAERFRQVAAAGQGRVDAAMYWLAYAQAKLAQNADALATLSDLSRTFPKSRWLSDARALEMELRRSAGQPVSPEAQADEELKLLAIQSLQHSDPAQAVPMLQKLLQGTQSPRLKERALFVLAQSSSPDARKVMTDIARGTGSNPDLQRKAIQYLGVAGSAENRQLLADVYQSSTDVDVKRQVLRAYMVSGDRARVLAAATGEKAPELRQEAVRQLGVMGARDELWQLYQKETDAAVKRQVLQALFVSGDATRLIELANTETDPELRRTAIRQLGTMGASRTGEALTGLYQKEKDPALKRTIIQSLFVQGNAEALVAMARKETDVEAKKAIVQQLSLMKSKVATDYLLELLGK
jgi:HEAT repeats/Tetratricopeptide repeat